MYYQKPQKKLIIFKLLVACTLKNAIIKLRSNHYKTTKICSVTIKQQNARS